jgi:ribosomal protein L29
MKNSEVNKLREKTPDELAAMAKEMREGMLKSRIGAALEGKSLGMTYRSMRRQIARIETILTQKRNGSSPTPAPKPAAAKASAEKSGTPAKKPARAKKAAAEKA